MSSNNDTTELMALVNCYARAIDRCEPDTLREILTEDVVLVGPGFAVNGIEEACAVPAGLRERFRATRHVVHNQSVTFDGNTAQGETYSTASHIHHSESGDAQVLVWEVRYQDQFKLDAGQWRISRRELLIDWTETRPIVLPE
jgi:ketosteroid isomerase-like protein